MRRNERGKAAYFLVDLAALSDEDRQLVFDDALMGGGDYGVRVVEEVINGPATQPIYGVYYGPDEEKWAQAQADFAAAPAGEPVENETDEEREERLRAAAERQASVDADAQRAAEEAELQRITKEDADTAKANKNKR
jgi:hypothetical protein